MKRFSYFTKTLLLLLFTSSFIYAQDLFVEVIPPDPTEPPLSVCGDTQIFGITLLNSTNPPDTLTDVVIKPQMIAGMKYVSGSLSIGSASQITNVAVDDTDPQNPLFTIDSLKNGQLANFTFETMANCDAIASAASGEALNFDVVVDYDLNGVVSSETEETGDFQITKPALAITDVDPVSPPVTVSTEFSKTITIGNGGLGPIGDFTYYNVTSGGLTLDSMQVGGITIQASELSFSGDTVFFDIGQHYISNYAVETQGDPDRLEFNEFIQLVEFYSILECNIDAQTDHGIFWGCDGAARCEGMEFNSTVTYGILIPDLKYEVGNGDFGLTKYSSCQSDGHYMIYRITNTGTAPAINFSTRAYAHDVTRNGIDTSQIFYQVGVTGTETKLSPIAASHHSSMRSCIDDLVVEGLPAYWADLSLPDVTIGLQDTLYVKVRTVACCQDSDACVRVQYKHYGGFYNRSYQDPCGFYTYNDGNSNPWVRIYEYIRTLVETEQVMQEGDVHTAEYTLTAWNGNIIMNVGNDRCNNCYYEFRFVLGNVLDHSGNADDIRWVDKDGEIWTPDYISYTDHPNAPTVDGVSDTLIVRYNAPISPTFNRLDSKILLTYTNDCFELANRLGCPREAFIKFEPYYVPDTDCLTCVEPIPMECATDITTNVFCDCGPCAGMELKHFSVIRDNIGLPDANNDGFEDGDINDLMDSLELNRITVGDIVRAEYVGVIHTNDTLPFYVAAAATLNMGGPGYYATEAMLTIVDSSAQTSYTVIPSYFTNSGNTVTANLSPDSLRYYNPGIIPADFVYEDLDTLYFSMKVKVGEDIGLAVEARDADNSLWCSDIPFPSSGRQLQCNPYFDRMTLLGTYLDMRGGSDINMNGCSGAGYYNSLSHRVGNSAWGQFFPYEIRDLFHVVNKKITIPTGFTPTRIWVRHHPKNGLSSSGYGTYDLNTYPGSPYWSFSGDTLILDTKQLLIDNGLGVMDETYSQITYMYLAPSCEVADNSYNDSYWKTTVEWNPEQFDNRPNQEIPADNVSRILYRAPALIASASQYTVSGLSRNAEWQLNVTNVSNLATAANTFIYAKGPSGLLVVDSVYQLTPAGDLDVKLNGTNNIFQAGNMAPGATAAFRIFGSINSCEPDSIYAHVGWNCPGYPETIDDYPCQLVENVLHLDPQPAELQMILTEQPDSTGICEIETYELMLTSAQLGHLYDVTLLFNLPPGVDFESGSMELAYPDTDNYTASIPDSEIDNFTGTWHRINISNQNDTLTNDGFAGILSPGMNALKLRFNVRTNCDFVAGSRLRFFSHGDNACGEFANYVFSPANPLNLRGLRADYRTSIVVNAQPVNPCKLDTTTVNFRIQNIGDLSDPTLEVQTGNQDSIRIFLPSDFNYVGNYNPISNAITDPNLIVESTENGDVVLCIPIVSGIEKFNLIEFELDISVVDPSLDCTEADLYVQTFVAANSVCSTTQEACNTGITTGDENAPINIEKPVLSIANVNATAYALPPDEEMVVLSLDIDNSGSNVDNDVETTIDFYYDVDQNAQYTVDDQFVTQLQFTEAMPADAVTTITDTIYLPTGFTCNLFAVIDTPANCLCSTARYLINNIPLENETLQDEEYFLCSDEETQIGIEPMDNYTYQWIALGFAPIDALSDPDIANPNYGISNTTTADFNYEYVVRTIRPGGCFANDTVRITIHPELNTAITGDTVVCDNAITVLDGGMNTLTGADFVHYSWSRNGVPLGIVTRFINADTPGTYDLLVRDAYGCEATATFELYPSTPPVPVVNPNGFITLCYGDSVNLDAGLDATNEFYDNYQWYFNNNPISAANDGNNRDIWAKEAGFYHVDVKNDNECLGTSATVTVSIKPEVLPGVDESEFPTFCDGTDFELCVTEEYDSYAWFSTGMDPNNDTPLSTERCFAPTASGSYFAIVSIDGCEGQTPTTDVVIQNLPSPTLAITSSNPICEPGSVQLTASPNSYDEYEFRLNGAPRLFGYIQYLQRYGIGQLYGGCNG